ncbi:hypothetical protein [Aidingimonas lacisalsi]|nr:hypothetical protein [Aidingimonas lacisalsi]
MMKQGSAMCRLYCRLSKGIIAGGFMVDDAAWSEERLSGLVLSVRQADVA